jgi:alkylation response protein AidB-like acyl-CoA dehydrogenase
MIDPEASSLVTEAIAIAARFAREELLPQRALLEKQGGVPDIVGVPIISAMRSLASQLGLPELAREAVIEATANDGIFLQPAFTAGLLGALTRALPGFALSFGASIGLCGQSILRRGTEAQRQAWARPVLACEKIGCWALTEAEAGSDAFSLRTRAEKIGDAWVLSGEKAFITNAPIADTFVIFARIKADGPLDGQIRPFLLERSDAGLTTSQPLDKMGMRSSPTGSIALDGVKIPLDRLLGDPEESGKRAALETLLFERAGLSAMALAIVEESLQLSLAWAKARQQFGQPIAQFQAVQLRLARLYAAQETIRALVEQGARLFSRGETSLAWLCAAKYTASTLATEAAMEAVQILGGTGYCSDARVEGLARDAKLLEIGGGTSDIQLLAVARELLR